MTLWDELYFEITLRGAKSDLKKFASFLKSGELDDFFEITEDHIIYDDSFDACDADQETEIIFTNDDYGIEIDEFNVDEFLELFCNAARNLDAYGSLYDCDDGEFHFTSGKGDTYYINSRKSVVFNDELDEVAYNENKDDE